MAVSRAREIAVAIVEDDDITRDCVREAIEDDVGFRVVGIASNLGEAIAPGFAVDAHVAIVDLALGNESGIDVIRALRERSPGLEIMAHTVFDDRAIVFRALEAGATSYLLKGGAADELRRAVAEVHAGGAPMSPRIARMVLEHLQAGKAPADAGASGDPISPRERQILREIDQGKTYKEIAASLAISVHTVHSHIKSIYERLHASGKRQALATARRRGLL